MLEFIANTSGRRKSGIGVPVVDTTGSSRGISGTVGV